MLPVKIGGVEKYIMHGEGLRTWPNGDRYDGEYRDGQAVGSGKFTYANGDIYEGQFENDRANGFGSFIQQGDGLVRAGMWVDNYQHGHGTE